MRVDDAAFAAKNRAAAKSPRFCVKIEFAAVSLYVSSHADIAGIPATHIQGVLVDPSISSQKLNPDQGRAEIGAASFTVADRGGEFSANLRALNAAGEGLRDKVCRFYLGYEGLAWSDFRLVGTQIVKGAAEDRGSYRINCNDVQRSARKDIFDLANTTIASTVEPADTTIHVAATAAFSTVKHGTSYTDAASSTVGYLKIKDEVIRYTGKTATSFTGCTRGVLGTIAGRYVADGGTPANRREKVSEYVYLELPAPKLAYALLTGVLHGDSANLPASWHLGVPTSLVKLADFTGLGADLWNTADDTAGMVMRFEGLARSDGKAFVETELLRPLGLFMPVYTTGELGLRRMTRVLADASGVATLDESNSVSVDALDHDFDGLHNVFQIRWNWNGKDFTRTTMYVDTASVAKHGRAPLMELKLKGLYGGRHTDGILFKLLDSIRDRYSAPPVRHRRELLHSLNVLEVGDVVRVRGRSLRDYTGAGVEIDRAMEVQGTTVDWRTGAVKVDLFGSTEAASVIAPTTATNALPDAFYSAQGTNLTSVMSISGGVVSGGPYTLAGGADLNAAGSTWYYAGDLTIPAGVTVNLTGNVQLRVRGYLTINGTLNGVGGGLAGVADNGTTTIIAGNPGWVGNSRGHDGVARVDVHDKDVKIRTHGCALTQSKHAGFPFVDLQVVGNALRGLPTDLRGTGGGPGGKVVHSKSGVFYASGGTGGAGGAGLCTISRGLGLGANAVINLTGAGTSAPTPHQWTEGSRTIAVYPGAGGAGGPGSYLVLIDGALLSVPELAGRFQARTGTLTPGAYTTALSGVEEEHFKVRDQPFAGYLAEPSTISDLDLSYSCSRIQYVPAPETAAADVLVLAPPTNLAVTQGTSGYIVSFRAGAGAPDGTVYEVWEHTSATPFASAVKRDEGATTNFFISRQNTTTVYFWVRGRFRDDAGRLTYSSTTPAGAGTPAGAAATAGVYASATPSSAQKSAASSSMTTPSVTAALVGGTGTTFAWTHVTGSTAITVDSPSAATTAFSTTGLAIGATVSAVKRCTINSTYTVDVVVECTNTGAALAVTASPTSVAAAGGGAAQTTASVTATASGGAGGTSYAWTRLTGSTGISADSPSAATTTFSASGLALGEQRTATFRLTATDSASSTATADVSVSITRSSVSLSISPSSITKSGTLLNLTTAAVTATPTGGTAPYAHSWVKHSGDAITCNSPGSGVTTFSATGLWPGDSRTAVFRDTVTDANGLTAHADITVVIYRHEGGNLQ